MKSKKNPSKPTKPKVASTITASQFESSDVADDAKPFEGSTADFAKARDKCTSIHYNYFLDAHADKHDDSLNAKRDDYAIEAMGRLGDPEDRQLLLVKELSTNSRCYLQLDDIFMLDMLYQFPKSDVFRLGFLSGIIESEKNMTRLM